MKYWYYLKRKNWVTLLYTWNQHNIVINYPFFKKFWNYNFLQRGNNCSSKQNRGWKLTIWASIIKIQWHSITRKNNTSIFFSFTQMFEVTYSFVLTLGVSDCIFLHEDLFYYYWDCCLNFNQVNSILSILIIFKLFMKKYFNAIV